MGNANKPKYKREREVGERAETKSERRRARSQVESGRWREYGEPVRTPVALGLIIIIKPITLADFALARWCWAQWECKRGEASGERGIVP